MSRTTLDALLDKIEAKIAAIHDDVRHARSLAAGENPVGRIIAVWKSEWRARHQGDYELTKADAGNFKRLVTKYGASEMNVRILNYLGDTDPWLVRQQHPLNVFFARVNMYQSRQADEWSCRTHTPPCTTPEAHAERFNAEYAAYQHRKSLTGS